MSSSYILFILLISLHSSLNSNKFNINNIPSDSFLEQYISVIKEKINDFLVYFLESEGISDSTEIDRSRMKYILINVICQGNIEAVPEEIREINEILVEKFVEEKYDKKGVKSYKGSEIKELFDVKNLFMHMDYAMEKAYEKRIKNLI